MAADRYPEKPAIIYGNEEINYQEFQEKVNRFANVLEDLEAEVGGKVALQIPNRPQFMESFFGTLKSGRIPVPLNLRMAPRNISYVLDNSNSVILVADGELAEQAESLFDSSDKLKELVVKSDGVGQSYEDLMDEAGTEADSAPVDVEDDALLLYTSGTTGKPKGVMLTHKNLLAAVYSLTSRQGVGGNNEVYLGVMPWYHCYGLVAIASMCFVTGATIVAQDSINPEDIAKNIEKWKVTMFPGLATLYNLFIMEYDGNPDLRDYDLSSVHTLIAGAEATPQETKRKCENEIFTNAIVRNFYGLTETTCCITGESPCNREVPGGIGSPNKTVEGKIVDPNTREELTRVKEGGVIVSGEPEREGEMAWKCPQLVNGYYKLPEKTEEKFQGEWFYSGDMGYVHEDGYFVYSGRTDNMIHPGGENVYPEKSEDALMEHPDIAEAAVVAAPHKFKGEVPVSFVVNSGAELEEDEIKEFALERVATYEHPRRVFFVDGLPKSASMKTQHFKLREKVEEILEEPLGES